MGEPCRQSAALLGHKAAYRVFRRRGRGATETAFTPALCKDDQGSVSIGGRPLHREPRVPGAKTLPRVRLPRMRVNQSEARFTCAHAREPW